MDGGLRLKIQRGMAWVVRGSIMQTYTENGYIQRIYIQRMDSDSRYRDIYREYIYREWTQTQDSKTNGLGGSWIRETN